MPPAKQRARSGSSASRQYRACGYTFDGKVCRKKTLRHYCEPRADRVVAFFAEVLCHTKGTWARRAFVLEDWQEHDIIRPLFGTVVWSEQWGAYVRQYRIAWIELARKQGKSELGAAISLYLLVGDDEEGAEVYGAAKDRDQAGKVWDVAERMRVLSPVLSARLGLNKRDKRLFDLKTGSWYQTVARDASGELGHNPHGVIFDEVISQPDGSLWDALRTAMGARAQPMMVALTTAGNDVEKFAGRMHLEMEKVQEDPSRAPHVFVYMRNTPRDADPWNEANWTHANPALGSFLSIQALRDEATEARNDPSRENAFRQFRLNQWVQQTTRWMPMRRWDASAGMVDEARLEGRACWAGLDMASTTDLAAWVLLFPPDGDDGIYDVLFRFWTPEAQIPRLDQYTDNRASQWVKQGFLTATEGDWIDYWGHDESGRARTDYVAIHPQIERDHQRFRILAAGYDPKEATATAQYMQQIGVNAVPIYQGYALSGAIKEMLRLVKAKQFRHGGHPVARWNADSAEVRMDDQERLKLVKPSRDSTSKRIDAIAAAANCIRVMQLNETHAPVELEGSLIA